MVHTANKKEKQMSKYNKNKFAIKLKKLKELRLQKMEKQLLDSKPTPRRNTLRIV